MSQPIHPPATTERPDGLTVDSSPTAAERLAIRTAHAVIDDGKHPMYSLVDQTVFALAAAGLLADSSTVALIDHTVRGLLAATIDRAVERNARAYPDDPAMATRRLGMRAMQRLVTEPPTEPLVLRIYQATYYGTSYGTFMTLGGAKGVCEGYVRKHQTGALTWSDSEDDPDIIELHMDEGAHTSSTGYTVTTITVTTTPDPAAGA